MHALIVAAGAGSRLRSLAESKPLAPVAGRPLIEHVVRSAAEGGATSFTIVTGYRAEPLESYLAQLGGAMGLPIRTVRNPDWERPNGLSVVAAAEFLAGEFLLMMSDHLFDPAIVRALIAAPAGPLILAIDRNSQSPLIDLDDATRVKLGAAGRIVRLGKTVDPYDAIDTGLFRTGPELVAAIRQSVESGAQGSLSEGVQSLADRGLATTLDVSGSWWLDVDDPRAFALAESQLGAA
ncbi:MAG: phosphocholine cytidylyltransferase family protein [Allosphingosinicella sp.]